MDILYIGDIFKNYRFCKSVEFVVTKERSICCYITFQNIHIVIEEVFEMRTMFGNVYLTIFKEKEKVLDAHGQVDFIVSKIQTYLINSI
jgi:hypothetical protein